MSHFLCSTSLFALSCALWGCNSSTGSGPDDSQSDGTSGSGGEGAGSGGTDPGGTGASSSGTAPMQDASIHCIDPGLTGGSWLTNSTDYIGDWTHPTVTGHAKIAAELAEIISPMLGR